MIEKLFKEKEIKLTKQRKYVYNVILNSNENCTIKFILLNSNNKLDKVTLYRIIDLFLEKEIINKKININNEIYYEINPVDHIHYINCIKCHKKEIIEKEKIETFENEIVSNYKIISHEIEFNGICNNCQKLKKDI